MGLLDGLRKRLGALATDPRAQAATIADVDTVRVAIHDEARRLGRRDRLSVTLLMEFSEHDLRGVDLFQIIAHLDAEGELINVQQDSFGNLKFDLADPPG